MKKFKYRAKKGPEEIVEGVLLAQSQDEAIDRMSTMGLLPIDLSEETALERTPQAPPRWSQKSSYRDLTAFYRQLGSLVKSGVSLLRALALMGSQFPNVHLRTVIMHIHDQVREGRDFSESLAAFPQNFSGFEIAMIHAGESVGRLDHSLMRIVGYREQSEAIQGKIKSALIYPSFLIVVASISIAFMLTFVIPRFSTFFESLGQQLPLATRILIGISHWCVQNGLYLAAAVTVVFFLTPFVMKIQSNKMIFDRLLLQVPQVGAWVLKTEISQLCRALEILTGSGMQLLHAMKVSSSVIRNLKLKNSFDECHQAVLDGTRLSEALAHTGTFPTLVTQFVQAGEESGKMDEVLGQIALWYEQDVEANVKLATSLLEPVIILAVGLILGGIVIAILLPVFSLSAQMT